MASSYLCHPSGNLAPQQSMDHSNGVCLVEEEKFGWTILTTVQDGGDELETSKNPLHGDALLSDEPHIGLMEENPHQHRQQYKVLDEKKENSKDVNDEPSESYPEEEKDADDDLEDAKSVMGEDFKVYPKRGLMWKPELPEEACAEFISKQTLVQHPAQKRGLLLRFSLVATIGFFGWVVISGLTGGGKNLRCLRLHSCSIKEGEPVLTTL